jgi:hypothetical protein
VNGKRGRILRALAAVVASAVCVGALGLPLYVFPSSDTPSAANVIDVLGPPTRTRLEIADGLLHRRLADVLVVTVSPPDYHQYTAQDIADCHEPRSYRVYCLTPDPFTTQGESRALARLAKTHGWHSAIVVTQTSHLERARIITGRCFVGRIEMVPDNAALSPIQWIYEYAYQTAGFGKLGVELVTEGGSYCG